MRFTRLPYREDSTELFAAIADEPWAVFLDSGHPDALGGRWDILACRPYATLTTVGSLTRVNTRTGSQSSHEDPLDLLRAALGPAAPAGPFPFAGGAIGYFAYDLARPLGILPASDKPSDELPEMAVGLYDWAVLVDHQARETHLVGAGRDAATEHDWPTLVERFSRPGAGSSSDWVTQSAPESNLDWLRYLEAFRQAQSYIADGDCYQINLTQMFSAVVRGSRWGLYRALRRLNPAPFGAYLNHPGAGILSTSPERFIELRGTRVTTRPIKGTRRGQIGRA
ncbi:MAG: aminodeoxychorismate synthase component I, partial [Thiobacillus sp.]|nr:aminodeoxychorismate synthase component I [Thiobacillus sp.]